MSPLWYLLPLVLALATTEANRQQCKFLALFSKPGRTEETVIPPRFGGTVEVKRFTLVRELSRKLCSRFTYFSREDKVFVRNGCDGIFQVCYIEEEVLAPVTSEPPSRECKVITLWSNPGQTERTEISGSNGEEVEIDRLTLLNEISRKVCNEKTYFYRGNRVYVRNGCEGKFRVCYSVKATTPAPFTSEAPREFCKTVSLWSNPGKTEVETVEPRNGGTVEVQSFTLLREISRKICSKSTFYARGDRLFIKNGCEGKFRVCYTEEEILAPVTSEPPSRECKVITLWSNPGQTESTEISGSNGEEVEIDRFVLLQEISRKVCNKLTYYFRGDRVFVRNGCEGKFRVCYSVKATTPAPVTSEAPREFCKTVSLWSNPGKTEVETVEPRNGGTVEVQSFTLIREISRKICSKSTFYARGDRLFIKNGCEGKFRVCYTERRIPSQLTDEPSVVCRTANMRSTHGQRDVERAKNGNAIVSVKLLQEYSKYKCRRSSYGFTADEAYAENFCEGKFEICETQAVQALTTAPTNSRRCKVISLWSRPGGTERTEVDGKVLRLKLLREISRGICRTKKTYYFRGNNVFVKDGCEGEFRVCYKS